MAKSLYAIGGLGLGACLVMSMMMQHLLKVQTEKQRSPVAMEIEQLFATRLTGEVAVKVHDEENGKGYVVEMPVLAGLPKQKLAVTAGNLVWKRLAGEKDAPVSVRVEVTDEGGKADGFDIQKPDWTSQAASPPKVARPTDGNPMRSAGGR